MSLPIFLVIVDGLLLIPDERFACLFLVVKMECSSLSRDYRVLNMNMDKVTWTGEIYTFTSR